MRPLLRYMPLLLIGGLIGPACADDIAACRDRASLPDDAIAACSRLIAATSPKGAEPATALLGRANAYFARRDYEHAMADYDRAIARDAGLVAAYGGRAHVRLATGDVDGAIADYNEALRLNPRAAMFLVDRGHAWRRKGDNERAIADYSEAIRIHPDLAGARLSRGLALERKGERELARADYEAVLALAVNGEAGKRMQDTARARLAYVTGDQPGAPAQAGNPAAPSPATRAAQPAQTSQPVQGAAPAGRPAGPAPKLLVNPAQAQRPVVTAALTAATPPAVPPAAAGAAPGAPAAATDAEHRLALVIGNGAYVNANALPNPPNDARAIARTLREMGFEVLEGADLDRVGMERLLREFLRKAPSARLTLMFYAGHGMQVDGKNYLVPVDARLAAPSDLAFETIELDKVLAGLDDAARANIIILDACRDNPLARSFAGHLGASRSGAVPGGLAGYATVGTGTLIAFATAPGHTALDGKGANSPFTTALIKYLRTPDIEVNQMLTRVRVEVAGTTGNRQIPWANSSLLGDVYLASAKPN